MLPSPSNGACWKTVTFIGANILPCCSMRRACARGRDVRSNVVALLERRLEENVVGEFFVDSSCIDCDACRQIAPRTFHDHGGQSSVYEQPHTSDERRRAM